MFSIGRGYLGYLVGDGGLGVLGRVASLCKGMLCSSQLHEILGSWTGFGIGEHFLTGLNAPGE